MLKFLKTKLFKQPFLILLLVLFSSPSIFSLFHPGFFQSDDGEWMVIRFSAFHQAFRDGQFPVRFLGRLNYGYGYPVANFLYPGFMYLAEIPKILGFSFVNSIKIILGLAMIGSSVFTFLWLRKFFGKLESIIGSLFYLYAPYHLFDLYKRGSIGEVLALAIIPFILWQIEKKSPVCRQAGFFFTTIGIAFLIIAHNTLAVLFLPLIILYMLLDIFIADKNKKLHATRYTLHAISLALGLSAFYWIPAVFELGYTRFSQTAVSQWNNYFVRQELVGYSMILIFLLTLFLFVTKKIKVSKHRVTVLLFAIGILSIFFATSLSVSLWNFLPVSFIQFPFRLLSIVILSASFLAACVISVLSGKLKIVVGIILLFFLLISSFPFLSPTQFFDKGEGFYSTNEGTTTVQDEYMPKWAKVKPTEHFEEKVEIVEGKGAISNLVFNSKKLEFNLLSESSSILRINTIYYPGWKAFVDGQELNIQYQNDQGVMEISVPKGEHKIKLNFSETPLRLAADIISVLSFLILIGSERLFRYKLKLVPEFNF